MIFERTREKGANKGKRIKKGKGWDLKVTSRMAIARLLVGMRGYTLARERGGTSWRALKLMDEFFVGVYSIVLLGCKARYLVFLKNQKFIVLRDNNYSCDY